MEHRLTAGAPNVDAPLSAVGKRGELGNRRQPLAEGGTGLLDLPLGVKIPLLRGSKPVFCRTKLGEKLHQPSGYFNLGDPYCRLLSTEYNSLHDPHLRAYHKRKGNLQRLKREGYVTSDGKVVCTLKELNEYRQYLTTLKLEAEKMFVREEKKLWRDLAKLEDASEPPGGTDVSRLREWLLQEQRKSFPGGERKKRQRHLAVIEKRIERLEALEKEQRRLQQAECQQQEPLGKRRQPDTQSSSEKSALEGRPSPQRAGEAAPDSTQPTLRWATLAEEQELKGVAETVVREVLERVKALDQSVRVLRRAPREVSGRLFASARGAEPLDTSSADRRDEIRLVAREVVETVLGSFGEHLASSTSDAAEPGPAARQKPSELVAGRATRAGGSGEERGREAELAASDRASSSQSSVEKMTKEAVESVSSTLSSFVASQFERDFQCQFSEILKLQGVTEGQGSPRALQRQIPEGSKRAKLPVLQPRPNAADVSRVSCEIAKESIQNAVSRVEQLDAELIGYARTIVLEVLETVKKLEEARKSKQKAEKLQPRKGLPPLSLPAIVTPSKEAGQFKEESSRTLLPSLLRGAEEDARRPAEGLQKPQDYTSRATARSSVPAWETLRIVGPGSTAGTLPSTGPQFPRRPVPPAGPKPPPQAGAWRRPVRVKLFTEEPVQPDSLKRAVARSLAEGVLRSCVAPGPQSPHAAPPGRE